MFCYPAPAPFSVDQFRHVIDTLASKNIQRGEAVDDVTIHCLGFVVLTYKILNIDRPIPRFSSTKEELANYSLAPFEEMAEGDFLLLRRKVIKDDDLRRRQRIFSHFALKYDDHRAVHFSNSVRIADIGELLEKRIHITRENLSNIVFDSVNRTYEYRETLEAAPPLNPLPRGGEEWDNASART